jgi:hypothetical protein
MYRNNARAREPLPPPPAKQHRRTGQSKGGGGRGGPARHTCYMYIRIRYTSRAPRRARIELLKKLDGVPCVCVWLCTMCVWLALYHVCVWLCACVCACVCVCVCSCVRMFVCELERERERGPRERECVMCMCMHMFVCERERERETKRESETTMRPCCARRYIALALLACCQLQRILSQSTYTVSTSE